MQACIRLYADMPTAANIVNHRAPEWPFVHSCASPVLCGYSTTIAADTLLSAVVPTGAEEDAANEASAWLRRRPAALQ